MSFDQPDYTKQEKTLQRQIDEEQASKNAELEAKKIALYNERLGMIKAQGSGGYDPNAYAPPKPPVAPTKPTKKPNLHYTKAIMPSQSGRM